MGVASFWSFSFWLRVGEFNFLKVFLELVAAVEGSLEDMAALGDGLEAAAVHQGNGLATVAVPGTGITAAAVRPCNGGRSGG